MGAVKRKASRRRTPNDPGRRIKKPAGSVPSRLATVHSMERMLLDRLHFHSRFRDVTDHSSEVTWNSGIDGTMSYLDKLQDDLFLEAREQRQSEDLLDLVNRFQEAFRSAVRSLIRKHLVNAFTDGYTVFAKIHVPLPNRWSPNRPLQRIKGLTLTAKGFQLAGRLEERRDRPILLP